MIARLRRRADVPGELRQYDPGMSAQLPAPLIVRSREALWVALDCALAAFLLALTVAGAAARTANFGAPIWLSMAAAVLVAAPVAVRRRWPVAVFACVLAANTVLAAVGVAGNPAVVVALALYTVAASRPPRRSGPLMIAAVAVSTAAEAVGALASAQPVGWQTDIDLISATVLILAAAWALGATRLAQRRYADRAAEQAVLRAVADERLRIARELHDVVTHSISLITVKASVANYLIDSRPQEVRAALTVIETTGRSTLTEMRRMLGVLRADSAIAALPNANADDGRAPAPGLDDLPVLAEHAAEAGVQVDLDMPAQRDLPEGVALSAYRIVQEALTNVVKHAAPTRCHVRVTLTGPDVVIDVTDTGRGPRPVPAAADGHGIIGMRERTALFGGEFAAGPRPHGGFRVTARLPLAVVGPAVPADSQGPG
jgi:signal transduction histidine kinase